jgi:XRE family transcriptional regulator, regulator of sulfur utilization
MRRYSYPEPKLASGAAQIGNIILRKEEIPMLTRRNLVVAAALTTLAAVTWAQSPAKSVLKTSAFEINRLDDKPAKYGSKRQLFDGRTAMLDQFECHVTTVNPGDATHPPVPQAEEELVIVKDGTVEAQINGQPQRIGAGSVLFVAGGDLHGVKNVGEKPAVYYVIRWSVAGTAKTNAN